MENTLDRKPSLPRMKLSPRQDSSAVEQGTHKPLAGSSILPPGKKDTYPDPIFHDQY
jgi:hypothetical protein